LKFLLLVEGATERALPDFLRSWLDSRLSQRVGIKPVCFGGWRDYYDGIARKVERSLAGKSGDDVIAAIGLLDLYGPTFYPPGRKGVAERYAWAKQHLEEKVAHPRFRQHFAVHETEAWLLSNPENLPHQVRKALPGKCSRPEDVNFDEPPAKLLDRLYRAKLNRRYIKTADGADLFEALQPEQAAGKCPYLRALLDDMLQLAQSSGLGKETDR
jgi:hypothetical protein